LAIDVHIIQLLRKIKCSGKASPVRSSAGAAAALFPHYSFGLFFLIILTVLPLFSAGIS